MTCKHRLIITVIATIVTVSAVVGYLTYRRYEDRQTARRYVRTQNCEYLGRFFGTEDVVVVDCDGQVRLERFRGNE